MVSLRPPVSPSSSVDVAFCCDAGYLQPLTVAIASLLATTTAPARLRLWLVTGNLDDGMLVPIRALVQSAGAQLHVLRNPAGLAAGSVALSEHLTEATYYRLLLPDLLPTTVTRLLYLDCDLVVRRSIEPLWELDLAGASTAAVHNPRAINLDFLGLAEADYFNAGVLLMDLVRWRRDDLHGRTLRYAVAQGARLLCHDQDALNHVLAHDWRPLELRWNQQFKFFQHPAYYLHVDPAELRRARTDPAIIHFTTNSKPWHYQNDHPWRGLYFHYLDQTPFRGWRPQARTWRERLRRQTRTLVPHPLRWPFWRYNLPPGLGALRRRLAGTRVPTSA